MALNRKTIPDDIDSLCTYLGLDPTTYHHFSNDAAPLSTEPPIQETGETVTTETILPEALPAPEPSVTQDTQLAVPAAPAEAAPVPLQPQAPSPPARPPSNATALMHNAAATSLESIRNNNLHVLTPLSGNVSKPPSAGMPANRFPAATRWPSLRGLGGILAKNAGMRTTPVAFHPIGGGVGLTTILATTAKALGMMGQRVLIADGSPRTTLPLFFGARDLFNGTNSLFVSNGTPTYLVLRDPMDADSSDEWLWSKAAQFDTSIDALLMEAAPHMAPRTQNWLGSAGVSIFVLEPDMRSAVALRRTLEIFAARQAQFAEPALTYFLLNKYDSQSALDADMRAWLEDELGEMLVPVVLRRDQRVSEALAEGQTVLDYAPESEIAQDFHFFAQWLRSVWKH